MQTIADIILSCGALGVAFYCFVLSRRLQRFNNLEHGVGGAVAVLSAQVDDLNRALDRAREAAESSGSSLAELTERADGVARRLELHVAAMHDLADPAPTAPVAPGPAAEAPEPAAAETPEPAPQDAADDAPVAPPASPDGGAEPPASDQPAPAVRPVRSFFAAPRKSEAQP